MKTYSLPQIQIFRIEELDLICTSSSLGFTTCSEPEDGRQGRQRSSIWSDYDEE